MQMEEKNAAEKPPEAVDEYDAQAPEEQPSYESLLLMLDEARAKAETAQDQLMRAQAEFENSRRRAERELEKARKYALDSFFQELLPVKDSLEMGLAAASEASADVAKLKEGMELTQRMIDAAMAKFGLKEINPLGQPFNPELHQAMTIQPSAEYSPNTVSAVFQKGYALNDRLIRPARVVVTKAPDAGSAPGSGTLQA